MNTFFYVSFVVTRKSDNAKLDYVSEMYVSQEEASRKFEAKIKRQNVTEAHLWKVDNYYKEEEIPFEATTNRTSWGWRQTTLLSSYDPKRFQGIKVWNA